MRRVIAGLVVIITLTTTGCRAVTPILSTGSRQLDSSISYSQECIYENILVGLEPAGSDSYFVSGNTNQNIVVYDLSTRKKIRSIDPPPGLIIYNPVIYGSRIVFAATDRKEAEWRELSSAILPFPNVDIYMYDLGSNQMSQLTSEEHGQTSPRIYGDTVVWLDSRNQTDPQDAMDIYALDLKTNKETRITANPTASEMAFSGNTIVWADDRSMDKAAPFLGINDPKLNYDIFAYNLESNKESRITASKQCDRCPAIDGSRITCLRQITEYKADIYTYDLKSRKETLISHDGCAESNPSIQNNRIVWTEPYFTVDELSGRLMVASTVIDCFDMKTRNRTQLTPSETDNTTIPKIWDTPVVYNKAMIYRIGNWADYPVFIMELSK
jgi:beta propeller repeat protein